jgi:aryl-alcohol dehydrogenase-like predicted oxidoreductase
MRTRILGDGLEVSAEGLGCMGMSAFYGPGDDAESRKVLDRAVELGVTFWDTSDMYGPFTNEQLVGKALQGRREQIVLATKFGIESKPDGTRLGVNGRPDYVKAACEASLKRLGVDHIDLYYQHRVDTGVPIEETWGALSELVAEGKVKYLGISEAAPATVRRAHAVHPVTAGQYEYSLFERSAEDEILGVFRELNIGLVAYSPLGRGMLTGRLNMEELDQGDFRRSSPRFQGANLTANQRLVAAVGELASAKGVTPGQLALAWVLAQGDDIVPIPGTKRLKYLEENAAAEAVELTADDLTALEKAAPAEAVQGARYADMSSVNR